MLHNCWFFRLCIYLLWTNMNVNNSAYIVLSVHWQKKESPCPRFLAMTRETDRDKERNVVICTWLAGIAWGYNRIRVQCMHRTKKECDWFKEFASDMRIKMVQFSVYFIEEIETVLPNKKHSRTTCTSKQFLFRNN